MWQQHYKRILGVWTRSLMANIIQRRPHATCLPAPFHPGFYPPDEEAEEWIFGEGTREAVLTLQASAGLPETGGWGQVVPSRDRAVRARAGVGDVWGGCAALFHEMEIRAC